MRLADSDLRALLPAHIADDRAFSAAGQAVAPHLRALARAIPNLLIFARLGRQAPQTMLGPLARLTAAAGGLKEPELELLELLAWQFHVDFREAARSKEALAGMVLSSIPWHRIKGTPASIRAALELCGYPGKGVLTEARLTPEQLVITGGGHTRVLFPAPVTLAADTEYAVVIMCNDAETALALAEVGQFDATRQFFVASQPYQVGVLFSSSNASAWTPHQDKDLAFRILEADFTAASAEASLGKASVTSATDLMVMALEDLPRAETRVDYELTLPGGRRSAWPPVSPCAWPQAPAAR